MNINKFTPGPWRVGDAGNTVFGPKMNDGSAPVIIASCDYQQTRLGGSKQANARLIAAAPELLQCAIDLESYLRLKLHGFRQDYPEDHCIVQTCIKYLEQVRSTIAKATGSPQ